MELISDPTASLLSAELADGGLIMAGGGAGCIVRGWFTSEPMAWLRSPEVIEVGGGGTIIGGGGGCWIAAWL